MGIATKRVHASSHIHLWPHVDPRHKKNALCRLSPPYPSSQDSVEDRRRQKTVCWVVPLVGRSIAHLPLLASHMMQPEMGIATKHEHVSGHMLRWPDSDPSHKKIVPVRLS